VRSCNHCRAGVHAGMQAVQRLRTLESARLGGGGRRRCSGLIQQQQAGCPSDVQLAAPAGREASGTCLCRECHTACVVLHAAGYQGRTFRQTTKRSGPNRLATGRLARNSGPTPHTHSRGHIFEAVWEGVHAGKQCPLDLQVAYFYPPSK
jgi:hypothetical protein